MTTTSGSPRVIPSLLAADLDATQAFYERLGFGLTARYPASGPASWIEVSLGTAAIQFYAQPPAGTLPEPALSGTVYICVADVDELAGAVGRHTDLAWGPETMDYGMREFAVRDPNGYFIAFTAEA